MQLRLDECGFGMIFLSHGEFSRLSGGAFFENEKDEEKQNSSENCLKKRKVVNIIDEDWI